MTWDGRILKIVNVGRTCISFLDDANQLTDLPVEHFETQLRTGRITPLQMAKTTELASMRSEAAKLIAAAGQAELETANRRYHAIESYLHGNVPIEEPLPTGLPARSKSTALACPIHSSSSCLWLWFCRVAARPQEPREPQITAWLLITAWQLISVRG